MVVGEVAHGLLRHRELLKVWSERTSTRSLCQPETRRVIVGVMGLLNWLRKTMSSGRASVPTEPVDYTPIGIVRNHQRNADASNWEDTSSDIIFRADLAEALDSIEGFSHLIVIFHLDRIPNEATLGKIDVSDVGRGVLATRSQLRPNPIGFAVVRLVNRRKEVLRVRGLDALDGSPVLDIKPYLPPYDSVPDAEMPGWATAPKAD